MPCSPSVSFQHTAEGSGFIGGPCGSWAGQGLLRVLRNHLRVTFHHCSKQVLS